MPPTIVLLFLTFMLSSAKIYNRCELARELKLVHNFSTEEIPSWLCIIAHESKFNTAATGDGSGNHGLFQLSQQYWCSSSGNGHGCNATCSSFRDDDITDDVKCARKIFKEYLRKSGSGFNAWGVYSLFCKGDISRFINGCFGSEVVGDSYQAKSSTPSVLTEKVNGKPPPTSSKFSVQPTSIIQSSPPFPRPFLVDYNKRTGFSSTTPFGLYHSSRRNGVFSSETKNVYAFASPAQKEISASSIMRSTSASTSATTGKATQRSVTDEFSGYKFSRQAHSFRLIQV